MPVDSGKLSGTSQRRIISNIVSIASEHIPRDQALDAVIEELQSLSSGVALSLSVYDPIGKKHRTAAQRGYTKKNIDYLDSTYPLVDPGYCWMKRAGKAFFNWEATETDYAQSMSARKYWIPSGFRGGSSNYLTNRQNRYVGNLHISTESSSYPSLETLQLIDDISPALSILLDVWQEPRALVNDLDVDENAFFIDVTGAARTLVDHSGENMIELVEVMKYAISISGKISGTGVLNQRIPSSCWYAKNDVVHSITLKNCTSGVLVTHKVSFFPRGLSRRQAEVCSLLSLGMTGQQTADALDLSVRTVDSHVENIFEKIGARNRVELVYFSITEGLINICDFVKYGNGGNFLRSFTAR